MRGVIEKWVVPASFGSCGQKREKFWSVFNRLLTWLWDKVWVGVRRREERVRGALSFGSTFFGDWSPTGHFLKDSCPSRDGVSMGTKHSDGG